MGGNSWLLRCDHTDLTQNELFQTLANRTAKDDSIAIWGPRPDWLGGPVFSVGKAIHGDYDNFLGMMSIDVDVELLERICGNIRLGKTGYIMLLDEENRIIYHPIRINREKHQRFVGGVIAYRLGTGFYNEKWDQAIN